MQQTEAISTSNSNVRKGQEGYLLIGALFLVALVTLSLAVAVTQIATDIRRDKEEELFDRGMQYERAIKLFYAKFNAYPNSIDALEKTNNIRYLRKRYKDPITGGDTWRLIHMGEAKLKPTLFFGEAIANTGNAGTNLLGGTAGGGISGAAPIAGSTSGSTFGNGTTGTTSSNGTTGTNGTTGSTDSSNNGFSGGGAIIGVSSMSTKTCIKEYRQQKHYNEWEFVYDPIVDKTIQQNMSTGGTNGGNTPGSVGQSWNGQAPGGSGSNVQPSGGGGNPISSTTPNQ